MKVEHFRSELQVAATAMEYSIQEKLDGTKMCMCQIYDNVITTVN
jgi:hypothetical protein